MKETCGIHKGYMRDTCILRGNQDTCRDTCGIHVGYMRDTCGIHAGHISRGFGGMYRCHHGEQRTYQTTHVRKKGNMPSEKQAMKLSKTEKFLWAESGKKDAGDFKEAVSFLPDVFGPGKYGTSGVNSRGGKQNYKDEWCAWKRFARDGRHFRVLEHTTGYFYQEGFLPSHTEAGEEEEDKEEEDKEEADDADDADKEPEPAAKKNKKEDKRAEAPAEAAVRHLRYLRQLPRRPRSRPSAHPSAAAASRARDTYPRMYPYVSDMYRECILCVMI